MSSAHHLHLQLQRRLLNSLAFEQHLSAARYRSNTTSRLLASARRLQSTAAQPHFPTTAPPLPTPKRSLPVRILRSLFTATIFFSLGIYIGWETLPARSVILSLLSPPPSDAETLTSYQPPDEESARINTHIVSHPIAQTLRTQHPELKEQRPHLKIPEAIRATNLTGGTLAGPGKIVVPPLTFIAPDGSRLVSLFYLGQNLCGHPGIIHGGLLATLLDEGLARCCFPAMPNGIAVTATLKVDYKVPVKAGEFYVLRAETTRVEGRKAWVRGWIEKMDGSTMDGVGDALVEGVGKSIAGKGTGQKLVEAEALFIEPRNASVMKRIYNVD